MMQSRIGFIGAGNMAGSLLGGMLARGIRPELVCMSDPDAARRDSLTRDHGVRTTADNAQAAQDADVLVLAVKPQMMHAVCEGLRPVLAGRAPLVISIAAGITVASLQDWLGELPVVRCMPNTPALVQAGATGLYAAPQVSALQRQQAEDILGSVGLALWFEREAELDAVTAVSGSGPAYFFLLMESMIAAGEALGLAPDVARQLVLQTALGAAQLAQASDRPPAELRRQVTSPGGTTAAALARFEQGGFRQLVEEALIAARDRATELSG